VKLTARLHVIHITRDRRNTAQLSSWAHIEQQRADTALERAWRERVARNIERRRLSRARASLINWRNA
jgi:hypothetical protein